jgi:hypothetical protein
MKLFFYKPEAFKPLIFLITKICSDEEFEKLEAWANELFRILIDMKEANNENILIFSAIKDYEKKTINLILPSVKSSPSLTERCHKNTHFINAVIIDILKKSDSEFYLEITNHNEKVLIHPIKLNLMSLSEFYSIKDKKSSESNGKKEIKYTK